MPSPDLEGIAEMAVGGGSVGGGFFALRWLVNWLTMRADKRQAQLDHEHSALDMSWKEYRLFLEARMKRLETQNEALRLAFQHATAALIRHDPSDPALLVIERIMARAFPLDFGVVTTLAEAGLERTEQKT
jgi:hypothetical protein